MSYIICAYHIGQHYGVCAKYLQTDCEKLGIEYDIQTPEELKTFGEKKIEGVNLWRWYCRYKPKFLLDMIEKHNKPIVYVDVDARIKEKFDLKNFDNMNIGVCKQEGGEIIMSDMVVSCIALRKNCYLNDFLKLWYQKCLTIPINESDHWFFKTTILDYQLLRRLTVGYLDASYVFAAKRDYLNPKILINARKYRRK